MRYRKKPVVIEAIRWTGDNNGTVMEFTGTRQDSEGQELLNFVPLAYPSPKLWVAANESWIPIQPGEWIIRDQLGLYPCRNEVFEVTYEPEYSWPT